MTRKNSSQNSDTTTSATPASKSAYDMLSVMAWEAEHDAKREEREWAGMRADLVTRMKHLSDNLAQKAEEIAAAPVGETYVANSLGEVQGAGLDIDRLCALLQKQADTLRKAERHVNAVQALVARLDDEAASVAAMQEGMGESNA